MGASDDYVAIMGDWFSPRTAFSSMRDDDIEPQSLECIDSGNQNGTHFPDQNSLIQSSVGGNNEASNSNSLARFRSNPRGGLVERMAARAGFNAPRLNVESIKPPELYKSPDIRSPYLTIPPGISPTALLESPVFLSNPMVHPSPTTGKLPFFPGNNRDSEWMADNRDKGKKSTFEETNASSYAFRAVSESSQITRFNAGNRSFHSGEVYLHSELQHTYPPKANPENKLFHQSNFFKDNGGGSSLLPNDQTHYSTSVVDNSPPFEDNSPPFDEQQNDEINGQDLNNDGNSGEDGYNWRKYGQKHVKGIEYPRSYYKCTHHNCPVKKKVERSHEGHITEIIYKGGHNHPKPLFWSVMQNGNTNNPEYNNGGVTNEIGDGVEESKNFSTNDDKDRATHGSFSLGRDGEGDEFESKKMRTETPPPEMFGATRAIREPRVVVQTKSEIDILDDGYRWRKYGQKVVKGNPNPRSYYKCTSQGCNVRKHVERASHDLKSVITTYEGKHNHEVPVARNSGGLSTQQGPVSTNQVNRSKPCPVRGRSDWLERPQLGPLGVGPGFGFGMNQPGPTTFGLGTNLQRFPVHTYAGNQVRPVNEMAYMMPKEEVLLDSGLSSVAGSSGYYQQLMSQLPLGPQM